MTTLILFLIFVFFGWKILAHNSQDQNPREYRNNTVDDDDPRVYHHIHQNQEERQRRAQQNAGNPNSKRRQVDDDDLLVYEFSSMNHNGMMYGMTNGMLTYMMLDSILDDDHHVKDHDAEEIIEASIVHDHLNYDDSLDMNTYDNSLETLYDNDYHSSDDTDSFDSMDDFDSFDDF